MGKGELTDKGYGYDVTDEEKYTGRIVGSCFSEDLKSQQAAENSRL